MLIKFLLYIIMKKKEQLEIDNEMQKLLDDNNYTPLEEWKANVQHVEDNNKDNIKGNGEESPIIT